MTQLQAVAVAQAAGFNVSVSHAAPPVGESVPPGTVFAQVPVAGTTARSGSGMILFVPPAQ
jgi:beta-lactam-binding protein with PASTA domain